MPSDDHKTILGQSPSLQRATHDLVQEVHTMSTRMAVDVADLKDAARQTATASVTLAALAEAREARDASREALAATRQAAQDDRDAHVKDRLAAFFAENWRYMALLLLLIFYPQVLGTLQAAGILPQMSAQAADPVVIPVPVPVYRPAAGAPPAAPIEPSEGNP